MVLNMTTPEASPVPGRRSAGAKAQGQGPLSLSSLDGKMKITFPSPWQQAAEEPEGEAAAGGLDGHGLHVPGPHCFLLPLNLAVLEEPRDSRGAHCAPALPGRLYEVNSFLHPLPVAHRICAGIPSSRAPSHQPPGSGHTASVCPIAGSHLLSSPQPPSLSQMNYLPGEDQPTSLSPPPNPHPRSCYVLHGSLARGVNKDDRSEQSAWAPRSWPSDRDE